MTRFLRLRRSVGRIPGTHAWRYFRRYEADECVIAVLEGLYEASALEVCRATGMRPARTQEALRGLEARGVVTARWAALEPGRKHRRRLYRIATEDVPGGER
ncbi:MAG TPA: hypothetical protein VGW74_06950 [Propionibacteriaceae bacterium]|nr:hypothetical protein [Propionibacteriaceae bacterium]